MLTDAWHVARVIGGDESEGQSSITNRLDLPCNKLRGCATAMPMGWLRVVAVGDVEGAAQARRSAGGEDWI